MKTIVFLLVCFVVLIYLIVSAVMPAGASGNAPSARATFTPIATSGPLATPMPTSTDAPIAYPAPIDRHHDSPTALPLRRDTPCIQVACRYLKDRAAID